MAEPVPLSPRQALDLPPVWLAFFAALAWGQSRVLPASWIARWGDLAGWALVAAGAGLMAAALVEFRRHRTTVVPHQEARALITTGVYRLSRNPIYLADAAILSGLCLIWGAAAGVVLVPGFMAVIARRFILPEEARLRARFGPAFEAWAARTGRWL